MIGKINHGLNVINLSVISLSANRNDKITNTNPCIFLSLSFFLSFFLFVLVLVMIRVQDSKTMGEWMNLYGVSGKYQVSRN